MPAAIALVWLLAGAAVVVAVIGLGMHPPAEAFGGAAVRAGITLRALLDLPALRRLPTLGAHALGEWLRRLRRDKSADSDPAGPPGISWRSGLAVHERIPTRTTLTLGACDPTDGDGCPV